MSTLLITLLEILAALVLVARFCARFPVFPLYDPYDPFETDNPDEDLDYDEGA